MEPRWIERLRDLGACTKAIEWAKGYSSLQAAWDACERGDRMLWLWGRMSGEDSQALVLAVCKCVRLALKYVPKSESRLLKVLQTIEKWARGKATLEEVQIAATYTNAAAYTTYTDAAYAAYAAHVNSVAYANVAVKATANAVAYANANATVKATAYANAATYAAYTAAYAAIANATAYTDDADAVDAAYAAAKAKALKRCAKIVRKVMPKPPRLGKCA